MCLEWDLPLKKQQLPGDFALKKFDWMIPTHLNYGDVILFNIKTIHAASKNVARPQRFRLSFVIRLAVQSLTCSSSLTKVFFVLLGLTPEFKYLVKI